VLSSFLVLMHQTVGERSGLWICSMRPRLQMLTLTYFYTAFPCWRCILFFFCVHLQWFWSPNEIQSRSEKDSWTDGLTFIFLIDFYLVLQQSSFWRLKGCRLAICTLNVQRASPWKIRCLWCKESVLAIKHLLSNH